jgi:hypothetical protein
VLTGALKAQDSRRRRDQVVVGSTVACFQEALEHNVKLLRGDPVDLSPGAWVAVDRAPNDIELIGRMPEEISAAGKPIGTESTCDGLARC